MRGARWSLALGVAFGCAASLGSADAKAPHIIAAPTTAVVARAVTAHYAPSDSFSGSWDCRPLGRETWRCAGTAVGTEAMDLCSSLLPCEVLVTVSWTRGQLHFARLRAG